MALLNQREYAPSRSQPPDVDASSFGALAVTVFHFSPQLYPVLYIYSTRLGWGAGRPISAPEGIIGHSGAPGALTQRVSLAIHALSWQIPRDDHEPS